MKLGELLIAERLIQREDLEEALENQVLYGGRLGTNLVELGALSERDLVRCLGKQLGVAFAAGEMHPDPRALALVEEDFCDEHDLLPMRSDETRVTVAAIEPKRFEPLDAIAFKAGKRVFPVVVAEFRMHQLLRKHCKAFRDIRPIDLNKTRARKGGVAAAQARARGPELMSEEEFQKLYGEAMGPSGPARSTATAVSASTAASTPVTAGSSQPAPPPRQQEPLPQPPVESKGAPPPVLQSVPSQVAPAVGRRARAAEAQPAPLSFQQAQALLAESKDREEVAKAVLRYASGKWARCLLLGMQGDFLTGWRAAGRGLEVEQIRALAFPVVPHGTFALVLGTRAPFVGAVRPDAGTERLYQHLTGGFPKTAVVLPLLVRERVAHLLYVDNGPGEFTPPELGELMILSQAVARSYESMLRHRR